jgi:hypothetical protein
MNGNFLVSNGWIKFFVDISTPFGSKSAPSNFDSFGETILNITKSKQKQIKNGSIDNWMIHL